MFIKSLKLQNFKIYEDEIIEFNSGLIGIFGKNGSGKSTIFNAIIFGLFGINKRETLLKKDYLLNASKIRGKDKLRVEVDFIFEGSEYKIIRRYSGKDLTNAKATIYKDKKLIEDDKVEGINSYIVNLIGMDRETFLKTTFTTQKELNALSSMGDEDRKKIIRKLLGFEKLDFIEKELKKQGNIRVTLKKEIALLKTKLIDEEKSINEKSIFEAEFKTIEEKLSTLEKKVKNLEDELNTLEESDSEFDKRKELKNSIEKELISLTKDSENFTKEISEVSIKIEELREKEKSLKELSLAKSEYEELKKIKDKFIALKELKKIESRDTKEIEVKKKKLNELKEGLSEYENLNLSEIEKEILDIEDKLKKVAEVEKELNSEISAEEGVIKNIKNQINTIKKLGKNAPCPTCTQKLDNFEEIIETLTHKIVMHREIIAKIDIDATLKDKNSYQNELNKNLNIKEGIRKKISEKEKLLSEIKNLQSDIKIKKVSLKEIDSKIREINLNDILEDEIEVKLKELDKSYQEFIKVSEAIKEMSMLNYKLKGLKDRLVTIQNVLKIKENEIKRVGYNRDKHIELKEKLKAIRDKQKELNSDILTDTKEKNRLANELTRLSIELDINKELKEEIEAKEIDVLDYEKIMQAISKFKLEINSTIAPQISEEASRLFAFVTNDKYQSIEVDENFKFYIIEDDIKYPIERFSGGEVDLANLILRVAISKVSNYINSNKKVSILAFDEIFGSQDEARREAILSLLNELTRDYLQIFVVTHIDDVKESFDNTIEL